MPLFALCREGAKHHVDQTKDNGSPNAAPKLRILKPGTNTDASSSIMALMINQNIPRVRTVSGKRHNLEKESDGGIDEANDEGGYRRAETCSRDLEAGHKTGDQQDCQGIQYPVKQSFQHRCASFDKRSFIQKPRSLPIHSDNFGLPRFDTGRFRGRSYIRIEQITGAESYSAAKSS